MKSILLGFLLIFAILMSSPSAAASDSNKTADSQSSWSRFWHGVADDWKKIGNDTKESGTQAGRAVKEEIKDVPENFRKGFEEAKDDFKNGTGSSGEPRTEN